MRIVSVWNFWDGIIGDGWFLLVGIDRLMVISFIYMYMFVCLFNVVVYFIKSVIFMCFVV